MEIEKTPNSLCGLTLDAAWDIWMSRVGRCYSVTAWPWLYCILRLQAGLPKRVIIDHIFPYIWPVHGSPSYPLTIAAIALDRDSKWKAWMHNRSFFPETQKKDPPAGGSFLVKALLFGYYPYPPSPYT
jgi:hypothetical protein